MTNISLQVFFIWLSVGDNLGVPIHVFGPETHMTAIVAMALGKRDIPIQQPRLKTTANFLLPDSPVVCTHCQHALNSRTVRLRAIPIFELLIFVLIEIYFQHQIDCQLCN